jgi:hypothetical protein
LIKTIMKVISKVVTWGVTPLPLKRNIIPIYKRRRSTRNDVGCIDSVSRRTDKRLKGGRLLDAIRDDILLDNQT